METRTYPPIHRRTTHSIVAACVAAIVFTTSLTACSSVATGSESGPQAAASQPTASPEATIDVDAPAPEPSVEPGAPTEAPEAETVEGRINKPIELPTGIVVELDSVSPTTVKAATPGEVSGSAVVVELSVANNSDEPADLDSAVVTLVATDGEYGIGTTAGPNKQLSGELAPGESATGSYVFMLSSAADRAVTISVNYAAGQPVAEFTGKTN